jgi:hypothetical protein
LKSEHLPRDDDLRERFNNLFTRFQVLYDQSASSMREYRLSHVSLVSETMHLQTSIFAENLDYIRDSFAYLDVVVQDVLSVLGGTPNACLQEVLDQMAINSGRLGEQIQGCAQRVNRTMTTQLSEVFYPTLADIQSTGSIFLLTTTNGLARGNLFEDAEEIIAYVDSQYQAYRLDYLKIVT